MPTAPRPFIYENLIYLDEDFTICAGFAFSEKFSIKLHPNTKVIASYAFAGTKVENIEFNENLLFIDDFAFTNTKIKDLNLSHIKDNLFLGNGCFKDNSELTNVILPKNIYEIPKQ